MLLTSPYGEVSVRVLLSDEVADGELWVPMQAVELNARTNNDVDPDSHTPAYKEIKVRLERTEGPHEVRGGKRKGADRARRGARDLEREPQGRPLPRSHRRYGSPTPQLGVQVERKWARDDYVPPSQPEPPGAKP